MLQFVLVEKNLKGDQIINLFSRDIPSEFMDQQETSVVFFGVQHEIEEAREKLLNLTTHIERREENLMAESVGLFFRVPTSQTLKKDL